MKSLITIIKEAQTHLATTPQDIAHDVGHHYRVWENCMTIIREEKASVDIDALQIAAWIHYIDHEKDEKIFLKSLQNKFHLSENLTEKIRQIIIEQAFGQKPQSIESKIVSDADRIELLSVPRWEFVYFACKEGIITQAVRDDYINRVQSRIPVLKNKLHFASSNKIFLERLPIFTTWVEKDQ